MTLWIAWTLNSSNKQREGRWLEGTPGIWLFDLEISHSNGLHWCFYTTWWLALGFCVLSPIMLSVRRKLKASSCDKAIGSFTRGAAFSIKTCLWRSRDLGSCFTLSQPRQRRQHGVRDAQQDGCALCLKWVSVFWAQAEIALLCRPAAVYAVSREVGRGHGTVFDFMWVGGPPSLEYNGCTRHCSLTYCPASLEKP